MITNPYDVFAERAKQHHPAIAQRERQLAALPPSRLATNLARVQAAAIDRLRDDHNPTFPLPDGTFAGPIGLAIDQRTNRPLGVPPTDLCGHTAIIGATGSGKTSGVAYITRNIAQHDPRVKTSYFDPKGDWRGRALADPRCLIITPEIPLNILRPPSFMHPEAYHALLFETFGRSHWAGYQQIRTLRAAANDAYARTTDPSIEDLVAGLRPMMARDQTYTYRDAAGSIHHKLTEFQRLLPRAYTAKGRCLTMEDLVSVPVYWPMVPGDTYEFLFTLWLLVLFHHNEAANIRDTLDTAVVIDESLRIFSAQTHHMEGSPLLERAISTVREVGIALFFTTSSWRTMTPMVRANTNTQLAMLTTDGNEAEDLRRTFQLTMPELLAYQRLRPLECLLRTPSRWPYAILASVPPFLQHEKLVNNDAWTRAATERQAALLPPAPPPTTINTGPTPNNTAAPTPVAHNATPTAPRVPPTSTLPAPVPVEPVRLSVAEEVLLRWLCTQGIATVTDTYNGAKLAAQVGDRAVKKLDSLGLLTRDAIIVRPGRGGKAVALTPTPRAFERLTIKPPHGTRGGDSVQHAYLVTTIARHIPGAMIETTLGGAGGKSMDIMLRITPDHEHLLRVIASNARYLSMTRAPQALGDLVAIEVETTSATVTNNARQNLAVGIGLNISAVMPKSMDSAQRALTTDVPIAQHARLVVIDALELLTALQEDQP